MLSKKIISFDFEKEAESLVGRVSNKLGQYEIRDFKRFKDRYIAAVESYIKGNDNEYTALFLVWKDIRGKLRCNELTDSRLSSDPIYVRYIYETSEYLIVSDSRDIEYKFDKKLNKIR